MFQSTQALERVSRMTPDPLLEDQDTGTGCNYGPLRVDTDC